MTKKDYIKIADVIKTFKNSTLINTTENESDYRFKGLRLIALFCEMLKKDNPKFNEDKFWNYILK